jgi:hypothetical protein
MIVLSHNKQKRGNMKAEKVEQLLKEYNTFVISYYAKKHGKIINRQGTWTKPNTDTQGKHFVSKEGKDIFVYWDLNAEPNDNGNKWRQATNPINITREVA